jgi:hypothetical protein
VEPPPAAEAAPAEATPAVEAAPGLEPPPAAEAAPAEATPAKGKVVAFPGAFIPVYASEAGAATPAGDDGPPVSTDDDADGPTHVRTEAPIPGPTATDGATDETRSGSAAAGSEPAEDGAGATGSPDAAESQPAASPGDQTEA